jgi:surfeit locus 1 family protein
VRTRGTFVHGQDTLVQASTALGSGFWVLTPLRMDDGGIVLVNRGFIPLEQRSRPTLAEGPTGDTVVVGLLRPSEPGGRWPRSNDPANARWFSRDVQAIASARGLQDVAPYFIDADPMPPPAGGEAMAWPVGGLTATSFPNHHLQYALTWYALAAMVFGAACYLGTQEYRRRVRRHSGKAQPTPRAHS